MAVREEAQVWRGRPCANGLPHLPRRRDELGAQRAVERLAVDGVADQHGP